MINTLTTIIIENKNIKTQLQRILQQYGRYEYNITKNVITAAYLFFFFKLDAENPIRAQRFKKFVERLLRTHRNQKLGLQLQLIKKYNQKQNIKLFGFPIETILQKTTIQIQP